jgi:YVTN family beta-propeller protein
MAALTDFERDNGFEALASHSRVKGRSFADASTLVIATDLGFDDTMPSVQLCGFYREFRTVEPAVDLVRVTGADGKELVSCGARVESQPVTSESPTVVPLGTTIPLSGAPVAIAWDPGAERLYAASADERSVSVLDLTTGFPTNSFELPGRPQALAVDTATHLVWVVLDSREVWVLDTVDPEVVAIIRVGARPVSIVIDAERERAYVSNSGPAKDRGKDTVSVIDTARHRVVDTIKVGDEPLGLALDRSANVLFVANSGSNTLGVVSLADGADVNSVPIEEPLILAVDEDVHAVYATQASGATSVIDFELDQVVPVVSESGSLVVAVNSADHTVYVAQASRDQVTALHRLSAGVYGSGQPIGVGHQPVSLALDAAGGRLFVANFGDSTVSVVSLSG